MMMAMDQLSKKAQSSGTRTQKFNAVNKTHKVDLGWYHYNAKQASYVRIKTHKVDLGWY